MKLLLASIFCIARAAVASGADGSNWPMERFVLDNVLAHQLDCGGWAKNIDKTKPGAKAKRVKESDATIDNNATTSEIRFLLRWHKRHGDGESLAAALRGIDWLLAAQLANGGWAQFPNRTKGYWTQITFNDNAMRNVLALMRDAAEGREDFAVLDKTRRDRCAAAFKRGIGCVLKCQIRVDGKPTVWCQQHDRETLAPTGGRAYELASFASQESAEILLLLMSIEKPSPEIVEAVEGGAAWFERTRLADGRWARFYDLDECRPFFCDRTGIPRRDISEIAPERQHGYSWFNTKGDKALKKYAEWRKNHK